MLRQSCPATGWLPRPLAGCVRPSFKQHNLRRALKRHRASGDDLGPPDDSAPRDPSIDELASFLTQKAAAMRASMSDSESELPLLDEEPFQEASDSPSPSASSPLPIVSPEVELSMHEGGFIAQEFTIYRTLGQLRLEQQFSGSSDTGPLPSTSDSASEPPAPAAAAAVLVYAARYESGLPYEGPLTVMLKEHLPGARPAGLTELAAQRRLQEGIPLNKWAVAAADARPSPPIVQLLGYFEAPSSDQAYELSGSEQDTLWLAYKWEGLRPLSLMLKQLQPPRGSAGWTGIFKGREAAAAEAVAERHVLMRAVAKALLSALSYCHARGVAHCGLGLGSVLLNGWEEKSVARLLVKLDNWGLAKVYQSAFPGELPVVPSALQFLADNPSYAAPGATGLEDSDALDRQRADLQAAALLLVQVLVAGTARLPLPALPDPLGLQRLLFNVFHEEVDLFRDYCCQDEETYGGFVALMDEDDGAGWEWLGELVHGKQAGGQILLQSRFMQGIPWELEQPQPQKQGW